MPDEISVSLSEFNYFRVVVKALRACLQGGRVTLASGLTLAGGQKIALVYRHVNPGKLNARSHSKGLETIRS